MISKLISTFKFRVYLRAYNVEVLIWIHLYGYMFVLVTLGHLTLLLMKRYTCIYLK